MQSVWFSGPKDKDKVKQDFAVAYNAFRQLSVILSKKIKGNSPSDYDKASWPYYQADLNGYNRAMKEVLNLIKEAD